MNNKIRVIYHKLTQSVRNGNCYACNISNSSHKALCQNWYENRLSIVTRFQPDPQRLMNLFAITSDGNETTYPSFESIAICGWSSEILTGVVNKWIISVVVIFQNIYFINTCNIYDTFVIKWMWFFIINTGYHFVNLTLSSNDTYTIYMFLSWKYLHSNTIWLVVCIVRCLIAQFSDQFYQQQLHGMSVDHWCLIQIFVHFYVFGPSFWILDRTWYRGRPWNQVYIINEE